jgi:hypothetical protein
MLGSFPGGRLVKFRFVGYLPVSTDLHLH